MEACTTYHEDNNKPHLDIIDCGNDGRGRNAWVVEAAAGGVYGCRPALYGCGQIGIETAPQQLSQVDLIHLREPLKHSVCKELIYAAKSTANRDSVNIGRI